MKISPAALGATVLGVVLAVSSCVELTGQRITLRYDASRDELHLLIHYDGIHENMENNDREGKQQIPQFLKDGDVMFFDWVGHVQMSEIRKVGENDTTPPAERALAAALAKNVKAQPVGRYRDPEGKIGAAQLVVISSAKDVVAKANAAINERILQNQDPSSAPKEWRMTMARLLDGARQGRQWLSIEGHSLRFEVPVHPSEWTRIKFETIKKLCKDWAEYDRKEDKKHEENLPFLIQLLTSTVSLQESPDGLVLRLGNPGRPTTFRFVIREHYEPSLEEVVAANVPSDLDASLRQGLLGPGEAQASPATAVREWGPPEEKVRALLGLLESKDPKDEPLKKAALERLQAIGEAWNREEPFPEAPRFTGTVSTYVDLWKRWYRQMLRYPATDA